MYYSPPGHFSSCVRKSGLTGEWVTDECTTCGCGESDTFFFGTETGPDEDRGVG